MSSAKKEQAIRFYPVPVDADHVLSPVVVYGDANTVTGIYFRTPDDLHARITFQELDAVRVCRGERFPYERQDSEDQFSWVSVVENSEWLAARYAYEISHYPDPMDNVHRMLTHFSHYLFKFHDEFVEVLASGICFEVGASSYLNKGLKEGHPAVRLPQSSHREAIHAHELVCNVYQNQRPLDELLEASKYADQRYMDFVLGDIDGRDSHQSHSDRRIVLRNRDGQLQSTLVGDWGDQVLASFEGLVDLATVRPFIEKWMGEIKSRKETIRGYT